MSNLEQAGRHAREQISNQEAGAVELAKNAAAKLVNGDPELRRQVLSGLSGLLDRAEGKGLTLGGVPVVYETESNEETLVLALQTLPPEKLSELEEAADIISDAAGVNNQVLVGMNIQRVLTTIFDQPFEELSAQDAARTHAAQEERAQIEAEANPEAIFESLDPWFEIQRRGGGNIVNDALMTGVYIARQEGKVPYFASGEGEYQALKDLIGALPEEKRLELARDAKKALEIKDTPSTGMESYYALQDLTEKMRNTIFGPRRKY